MYSKREQLEKFRRYKGPLIDVRSPDEYYKGNLPNSINVPLFNNEERSIIGKIYKNYGREKAVIKGLEFVANRIDHIVNDLINSLDFYKLNNNNSYFFPTDFKIFA